MLDAVGAIQTVLISCSAEISQLGKKQIKHNLITVDWHMPVSFTPQLYAIAVGKNRFSLRLIDSSSVFCVNFMHSHMTDKLLLCGSMSGEMIDKFEKAKLTREECRSIDCCRVAEAPAWIECHVVQRIEAGDHIIFIGEVLSSEKKMSFKRPLHARGGNFTSTKEEV